MALFIEDEYSSHVHHYTPTASRTRTTVSETFLRTEPAALRADFTESVTKPRPREAASVALVGRSILGRSIFGMSNLGRSIFGTSNLGRSKFGRSKGRKEEFPAFLLAVDFWVLDFLLAVDFWVLAFLAAVFFLGVSVVMRPSLRERSGSPRARLVFVRRRRSPLGMRHRSAATWCAVARTRWRLPRWRW